MLRYVIRRVLYMVPTVLGVILITFVLFNVVGGSPAAAKLGKNATAKELQMFEEQRGLDKPALAGRWCRVRAYEDADFERNAGKWRRVEGVAHVPPADSATRSPAGGPADGAARGPAGGPAGSEPGHVVFAAGRSYEVPLEFRLDAGRAYRLRMHYRLPAGSAATWVCAGAEGAAGRAVVIPSDQWVVRDFVFRAGADPAALKPSFVVDRGRLEVRSMKLQRRNRHVLDSQLGFFLAQIARFDLGRSYGTNEKVSTMLRDGVLPSLALAVPIFTGELLAAISLALLCAFFRDSWLDRSFVIVSVVLMSVNYLVWIIFGQYFLAYVNRWFPIWGFESWRYLALPVLIGVVSGLGAELRLYRTIMLDEMYRDYVRTAFAKGVSRRGVLFKHVLKNAMIPILTSVVMTIPFLYTGNLLLESFFGIPGLGNMGVNAFNNSDFDVIRGLVLVGSVIYVIANLLTDICYAIADPRVRLGG